MPKVSIIVPTYNVENYLVECMESIINQTLQDIEIICIDDGSTDSSGKILDEYAAKDSRIKIIHKENGGYGKAMNVGLDNATGEYIGIVEPDDYIELDMYEELYKEAQEKDIDFVKSNYFSYCSSDESKNKICEPFDKKKINKKFIKPINYIKSFGGGASIWSAIYKRSFLTEKNIRFLETPGASFQDTSFYIQVLLEAERAIYTREAYYHYRTDNENSSVKSNSKIFCICDEFEFLENKYKNASSKVKKIINTLKIDKYTWNYNRLNEEGQNEFLERYREDILPILKKREFIPFIHSKIINKTRKNLNIKQLTLKTIFSLRNSEDKEYKILTILGLNFKFRRKKYA